MNKGREEMKLQEGETVIHELRPEPAVLGAWLFDKCLAPATVVGGLCGVLFVLIEISAAMMIGGFIAGTVVGLLPGLVYCAALRETYVYYITDRRCVFHGGILRRVRRSVPYHKITDVEMSQDIIERALGLSSLNIFTPGTGSIRASSPGGQRAEISFVGLRDSETPAHTINGMLKKLRATDE